MTGVEAASPKSPTSDLDHITVKDEFLAEEYEDERNSSPCEAAAATEPAAPGSTAAGPTGQTGVAAETSRTGSPAAATATITTTAAEEKRVCGPEEPVPRLSSASVSGARPDREEEEPSRIEEGGPLKVQPTLVLCFVIPSPTTPSIYLMQT